MSARRRKSPPRRKGAGLGTWLALAAAAIVVAVLALAVLETRREARLAASLPEVDLADAEPRVTAAIEAARRAVEADPLSAESWGALGATYDAHGLFDAAEACYRIARDLDDEDFRWTYLLAIVRDVNGGDPQEVESLFRAATKLREDYAPAWFRLGHALSLRGAQAEAQRALERAVALDPDLALAHREMGQVLLALDEPEAALAALRRAAELNTEDAAVWSALAQALARVGRQDDARRAAEEARGLETVTALRDPVHGQYVAARGTSRALLLDRVRARLDNENWDGALAVLEGLVRDDPEDAQVRYLAGVAHARRGDAASAGEQLELALLYDPDHVGALLESGLLLENANRLSAALERYERAFAAAPDDPFVLASLARARALGGDDFAAVAAFEALAAVTAPDARTLMNWGNALSRLSRTSEAVARYREALERQPGYAHAHYNLAVALEELGQREEAARHYREAERLDPALPADEALARLAG